jgi:hypothetical protein
MTHPLVRRSAQLALAPVVVLALSGCHVGPVGAHDKVAPTPSSTATVIPFDSVFTHDGTFQSHSTIKSEKGMDFVFTLYPTKSTPRTGEWYAKGNKYFSFTFQAYDLSKAIRAPFDSKRKVWLSHITVTSATVTDGGGATQSPYSLDAKAAAVTFDPQPLTNEHGMMVTSPKGAFELRNQQIGTVSSDTRGVNLTLTATVWVESAAGSDTYTEHQVKQVVPIAIFSSPQTTTDEPIPVDAN